MLEALSRSSRPPQIRLATIADDTSADLLEDALSALAAVGAIEVVGADRHRRIVATPTGEELIRVHQTLWRWARFALPGEEVDFALQRSQMQALATAWEEGIVTALAGRSVQASAIAKETGRDQPAVDPLLMRLSLHGLVARVGMAHGLNEPSWVLLSDAKWAVVPLAAAITGELQIDPSSAAGVTPTHINTLMRLCLEVLNSSHLAARPSGSYAMLCDLPNGTRTGWVGQFDGGEVYSMHLYRQSEVVDGGFAGSLGEILDLLATGRWRSVQPLGPQLRGGQALALAVATALGRIQGSAA